MAKHSSKNTKKRPDVHKSASQAQPVREVEPLAEGEDPEEVEEAQKPRASFRQIATTVIVVFFALLMAVSMMLPSFAQIFSSNRQADEARQQMGSQAQDTTGWASGSGSEGSAATSSSVDGVLNAYADQIADQEQKLQDDPDNLAALLGAGNAYMTAASQAQSYASTEADAKKIIEFYDQAISYFDRYLELNDSVTVKVSRALCILQEGKSDEALTELQQITKDYPDYGPGWAYLGLALENKGNMDSARKAFEKAQEVDPNDEYGAKTMAAQGLAQIEAQAQQSGEQSNANNVDAAGEGSADSEGLEGLANELGTKK